MFTQTTLNGLHELRIETFWQTALRAVRRRLGL